MDRKTFVSSVIDGPALKRVLLALCVAAVPTVITACQTTEGFGRDVEALGDNIGDSADENGPPD